MRGILPLFSVPVAVSSIPDTDQYLPLIGQESYSPVSVKNGYMSDNRRLLDKPEYALLKQAIDTEMQTIANEIWHATDLAFSMTSSWSMKHIKGNHSHRHHHPNSILSGILYLACDEASGNILFHKKFDNIGTDNLAIKHGMYTEINSQVWSINPVPGQIIAFPGNLEHSVEENKSNIIRYCVAFNYFIEGKLGGNEMSIGIKHGY